MFLGWLRGAEPCDAAVRASPLRRGRPLAHVQFAHWHRARGLSGSADRMLRDSRVDATGPARAWPRYDAMRTELAVGQFAGLVDDVGGLPTLEAVLEVARRKSGNYTVRRPLEIGAAMAGCGERVPAQLGGYGEAVGEAFQLRDDLLGIFGARSVTGKPAGVDLAEHKAISVVAAHHMADATLRRQLSELMRMTALDETDVGRWRTLIADRLHRALDWIDTGRLDGAVRAALVNIASVCTRRAA
jgi:geranylgeranyl diphosphate synthase type I